MRLAKWWELYRAVSDCCSGGALYENVGMWLRQH